MELQTAITKRRSIRKYTSNPVPDDDLTQILEAGLRAPYSTRRHHWFYVVVKDDATKRRMMGDFYKQGRNLHVVQAPVAVVLCINPGSDEWGTLDQRPQGKPDFKELFTIQESAAAIQNMLLTAHERGLGTCWNGSFDENAVRTTLNLPSMVRPIAIISIGYADKAPEPRPRPALDEVVHRETYLD
jgi:nitroreductase